MVINKSEILDISLPHLNLDILSKSKLALLEAYKKGYFIDEHGNVYGIHSGKKLKLKNHTSSKKCKDYYTFSVQYNHCTHWVYVHQYVAMLKYGSDFFDPCLVVRHKDGNHYNNGWSNIILGTLQENSLDIPEETRRRVASIANKRSREFRKYKDDLLDKLFIDRYDNEFSYRDLVNKYGIPKSSLSFLFNKSVYSKESGFSGYVA